MDVKRWQRNEDLNKGGRQHSLCRVVERRWGIDEFSSELLKSQPYSDVQKIKNAFGMMYKGQSKAATETWFGNIVLIPKKKGIDSLEGQKRGICVQSVLVK